MKENGHKKRVPPINLTYEEAKQFVSAKESFGWPPGSDQYLAFERARTKVWRAVQKAEASLKMAERGRHYIEGALTNPKLQPEANECPVCGDVEGNHAFTCERREWDQPKATEGERCPICGEPVRVATGSEGTSHYESVAASKLTEAEDRIQGWVRSAEQWKGVAEAAERERDAVRERAYEATMSYKTETHLTRRLREGIREHEAESVDCAKCNRRNEKLWALLEPGEKRCPTCLKPYKPPSPTHRVICSDPFHAEPREK